MAARRMFSKTVITSDKFLDLPASARCLYFAYGMEADDDGFLVSPKAIMRMYGSSEDDLRLLAEKNYIIMFESGVIAVTHWNVNNNIRADRYNPTNCKEKELVGLENGEYYLKSERREIESDSTVKITKQKNKTVAEDDSPMLLFEDEKDNTDVEEAIDLYKQNYDEMYKNGILQSEKPIENWDSDKIAVENSINEYGIETVKLAINNGKDSDFVIKRGYSLSLILCRNVMSQLINGGDLNKDERIKQYKKIEREKIIKMHPKRCNCGTVLVDSSSGGGSSWYCTKCHKHLTLKGNEWLEEA